MRKFCALALTVLLAVSAAGCGTMDPDEAQESIQVIAMDTAMIFTAYGVNSTKADYDAEEEVYRLEAMLSRTDVYKRQMLSLVTPSLFSGRSMSW